MRLCEVRIAEGQCLSCGPAVVIHSRSEVLVNHSFVAWGVRAGSPGGSHLARDWFHLAMRHNVPGKMISGTVIADVIIMPATPYIGARMNLRTTETVVAKRNKATWKLMI